MSQKEDCFHLGVKALISNKNKQVLLLKRAHPSKQTDWDIPGGRIQKGESLLEALLREVREETGFAHLDDIRPFGMFLTNIRIPVQGGNVGLVFKVFHCQLSEAVDPILSEEHSGFEWLDPKEAALHLSVQYPEEFLTSFKLYF